MTREQILAKFEFYRRARPEFQQRVRDAGQLVRVKPGGYFVCEGDHAPGVGLIGDGALRVFKSSASGREITLYWVRAGELCLLNLLGAMTGVPSPAHARVEEEVIALVIPHDTFRGWIGSDTTLRTHVLSVMTAGMVEVMALVEEIAFKKLDLRLAQYLCDRFFGGAGAVAGVSELQVTHEAIAAELGSAREPISRLLKEFENQGAIVLSRGRITLGDARGLRAMVEQAC
ncbi:MAG: Crp/Fnr family transcriptional regulator [bacterium]|nr:Crp/Fnr family transcriptional regulator [bacterium]